MHADSQHTPSLHTPDAHKVPSAPQGCPFLSLHAPLPSHVRVFVGLHSASSAPSTVVQVPVAHDLHAPEQPSSQHFPSTQNPLRHWVCAVQANIGERGHGYVTMTFEVIEGEPARIGRLSQQISATSGRRCL